MLDKTKHADSGDNDPIAAAERAQLTYVSDSEPGIRRKGRIEGLDDEEALVLCWLKARGG